MQLCPKTPANGDPQHHSSAPSRIRTYDTGFRKPLLYPLSYGGREQRLAGRAVSQYARRGHSRRARCGHGIDYALALPYAVARAELDLGAATCISGNVALRQVAAPISI